MKKKAPPPKPRPGRPREPDAKIPSSIRVSREVLDALRATGNVSLTVEGLVRRHLLASKA